MEKIKNVYEKVKTFYTENKDWVVLGLAVLVVVAVALR